MAATQQQAAAVNTRRVAGRRTLRFSSLDDVMIDAMRLAESDRAGTLTTLGNWTLGQAFGHVAGWMNCAFDGYPMRPPWFVKLFGRAFKNRVLRVGMMPGIRIAKTSEGTYHSEMLSLDEGLDRLSRAVDRLRATTPTDPNPVFGPLTHPQWIDLNLRHAELHLSFFQPGG